jgi:hypothetical protein
MKQRGCINRYRTSDVAEKRLTLQPSVRKSEAELISEQRTCGMGRCLSVYRKAVVLVRVTARREVDFPSSGGLTVQGEIRHVPPLGNTNLFQSVSIKRSSAGSCSRTFESEPGSTSAPDSAISFARRAYSMKQPSSMTEKAFEPREAPKNG